MTPSSQAQGLLRTPLMSAGGQITPPWARFLGSLARAEAVDDLARMLAMTVIDSDDQPANAVLVDTHANRTGYAASSYPVGTEYWESDRTARYQVQVVSGAYAWVWVGGECRRKLADIPADLAAGDAGFLFQVADYGHLLRWTATAWEPADELGGSVKHFLVSPWTHWGTCDIAGAVVTWKTGPKFDLLWGAPRIFVNGAWAVVQSVDSATQITLTAAPGDAAGAAWSVAIGWHYCDGNGDNGVPGGTVSFLRGNGTAITVPPGGGIPDLTAGAYLKLSSAYSGAVTAATLPTTNANALVTALIGTGAASASGVLHSHTVNLPGDPIPHMTVHPWFRK